MNNSIIIVLLTFIATSLVLALLVYSIAKRKIKASTERLQHELQNLRYELTTKTTAIELAAYKQISGDEKIIYNSSNRNMIDDFTAHGARAWDYVAHRFSDDTGTGSHHIEENTITINRTNTEGRYELYLKRYSYENSSEKIPADNSISVRNLRLTCEVKKGTASHILRFVFKGEASQNVLDEKDYVVFSPEWERVNLVFTISSKEASYLRIDDLSVLEAPSQIQIRNIVLYEKR